MKITVIVLLIILIAIIGCQERENKNYNSTNFHTELAQSALISKNLEKWKDEINNGNTNAI